jgi:hypothetical protein
MHVSKKRKRALFLHAISKKAIGSERNNTTESFWAKRNDE